MNAKRPGCVRHKKAVFLSDVFPNEKVLRYLYDLGNEWEHLIEFAGTVERYPFAFPRCTMGAGDAPPEDADGADGYADMLRILSNSKGEDYQKMKQWGEDQQCRNFDMEHVNQRLRLDL